MASRDLSGRPCHSQSIYNLGLINIVLNTISIELHKTESKLTNFICLNRRFGIFFKAFASALNTALHNIWPSIPPALATNRVWFEVSTFARNSEHWEELTRLFTTFYQGQGQFFGIRHKNLFVKKVFHLVVNDKKYQLGCWCDLPSKPMNFLLAKVIDEHSLAWSTLHKYKVYQVFCLASVILLHKKKSLACIVMNSVISKWLWRGHIYEQNFMPNKAANLE